MEKEDKKNTVRMRKLQKRHFMHDGDPIVPCTSGRSTERSDGACDTDDKSKGQLSVQGGRESRLCSDHPKRKD